MAADGLPTILDLGITHSLADTYSRNTSVGVRGYAANRYAKTKDTAYTKIIADKGLNLHYRSAVMETYGAFGDSLWGIVTELTDPNSHPHARTRAATTTRGAGRTHAATSSSPWPLRSSGAMR